MKKLIVVLMLFFAGGCLSSVNPETGETQHYIDPNVAERIEVGAQGAVDIMTALAPLFPFLTPVLGAGFGGLAIWKKLKPKLTTVEAEKDDFYRGGEVLSMVLEEIKLQHPDTWEKMKPKLDELTKESYKVESAIRGFRHLPAKG